MASAQSQNILLIEDDTEFRNALAAQPRLQEEFDVEEAGTGEAAIANAEKTSFNAILLDIGLPDNTLAMGAYDTVLCFNTPHLVTDLPAVLRNLHDTLKPGSMFISKTVCLSERTRLWAILIALMRPVGKAPYVNMLTFETVENAIADVGFEIIETGIYPAPYSRFVAARKI